MKPTTPIGGYEPATETLSAPPRTGIQPSLVAAAGESCAACHGPMSSDQRYCVACGERRGAADLPFALRPPQQAAAAAIAPRAGRWQSSLNANLIAAVGTLLLAMGVGVLIGRTSNNPITRSPPTVITVGAGPATATSATPATTTPTTTTPPPTAAKPKSAAGTPANKKPAAAPAATTPAPGLNRTGVQNGKFTGNFFGG